MVFTNDFGKITFINLEQVDVFVGNPFLDNIEGDLLPSDFVGDGNEGMFRLQKKMKH